MTATQLINKDLVQLSDGSSKIINGNDEALQYINNLMEFTLNEFFIEPLEGVDWFGIVEPKDTSRLFIRNEIIKALNNDNRVTNILSVTIDSINNQTRNTEISFKIQMDSGIFLDETLQILPSLKAA